MRQEDRDAAERALSDFKLRAHASAIGRDDGRIFVSLVVGVIEAAREDEKQVCQAWLDAYSDDDASLEFRNGTTVHIAKGLDGLYVNADAPPGRKIKEIRFEPQANNDGDLVVELVPVEKASST